MNRERAKDLLPIIEAFADGKDIQVLYPRFSAAAGDTERWADTDDITGKGDYRIKPVPREFWIDMRTNDAFCNRDFAIRSASASRSEVVHVREVIE